MDSPYRPGFGARPAVLVGREQQLSRATASLTRVANSGRSAPSALVFTGVRGMGKTVTLGVVGDTARERGFLTAAVVLDSVSDGVQLLAAAAAQAMAPLQNRSARVVWAALRERFAALATEVNAGVVKVTSAAPAVTVVPASATAQRQVLAELLAGTARLAHENEHRGLAVCIDEFQEAPHEQLVVIANALQDAMGEADAPLVVFGAGLPGTPERVMAAASFTERFDFRVLDRLSDDDAERALLEPALGVGVGWAPEAAARVLAAAAGSPYLVQRFGDEAWGLADRATGSLITVAQAQVAVDDVRESLAQGMFRGRWAKASPAEQELMVAVAQVADPDGVARSRHYAAVAGGRCQAV